MIMIKHLVIVQHDSRWCSIRESSQQLTSTQVPTRLSFVNASKALRRRVGRLVQCVLFPNFCNQPHPTPRISVDGASRAIQTNGFHFERHTHDAQRL
jgi:hypothetical protein